jgi:hypothetical protein
MPAAIWSSIGLDHWGGKILLRKEIQKRILGLKIQSKHKTNYSPGEKPGGAQDCRVWFWFPLSTEQVSCLRFWFGPRERSSCSVPAFAQHVK